MDTLDELEQILFSGLQAKRRELDREWAHVQTIIEKNHGLAPGSIGVRYVIDLNSGRILEGAPSGGDSPREEPARKGHT